MRYFSTGKRGSLIGGILLLAYASFIFQPARQTASLFLSYLLGALLIAAGVSLPPFRSPVLQTDLTRNLSRAQKLSLLLTVLVCTLLTGVSLWQFRTREFSSNGAWLLHLSALVVLVLGTWRLHAPFQNLTRAEAFTRGELLLLFPILLVALAFRVAYLTSFPYGVWFDEAQNMMESMRIMQDSAYRPVFISNLSQLPALCFYLYAPFVALFGENVLAIRSASTAAGLAAVVCTWLLGREMFGRRIALFSTFLIAISRWHVDFSRFGMAQIFTTLFIPLTLYLFFRSQRRLSYRDAVLAGISLGFGLQTYYAMLAFAIILLVLICLRCLWTSTLRKEVLSLGCIMLFAACITYAPVLQFAHDHFDVFNQRVSTVSSVKINSSFNQILKDLWQPTLKHLSMFHLVGDPNGRHNLPGEPMLDPVSGVLFAVGLVWCVLRLFRLEALTLLLWFGACLLPGILSLPFEAPQGARTIGLTPLLAILGAFPLAQLSRFIATLSSRAVRIGLLTLLLLIPLTFGLCYNWHTYFDRQRFDASVWASFSTPETKIGEVIRDSAGTSDFFIPPTLRDSPTQRFIAGRDVQTYPYHGVGDLPLALHDRDAILFLQAVGDTSLNTIKRIYPHARIEKFGPPRPDGGMGEPVLLVARIPLSDDRELKKWPSTFKTASEERVVSTSSSYFDWSDAPLAPPFQITTEGALQVPQNGEYTFLLDSSEPINFWLAGESIFQQARSGTRQLYLVKGVYRITLEGAVSSLGGKTSLQWLKPENPSASPIESQYILSPNVTTGALLGTYYSGLDWSGETRLQRLDPEIAFYFHELPIPRPFSVRWTGSLYVPQDGMYQFATSSIDDSFVSIDAQEILSNTMVNSLQQVSLQLRKGWHAIEVRYRTHNNYSQVYLYWTRPGAERSVIPPDFLHPPGPSGKLLTELPPPRASMQD